MGRCLKCGKKTAAKAVFCEECQNVMANYPVKPGTVVHLPQRQTRQEKPTELYSEEASLRKQLGNTRVAVRLLAGCVALLSLLLTVTAVMLIRTLTEEQPTAPIGRNYTTVDTSHQP